MEETEGPSWKKGGKRRRCKLEQTMRSHVQEKRRLDKRRAQQDGAARRAEAKRSREAEKERLRLKRAEERRTRETKKDRLKRERAEELQRVLETKALKAQLRQEALEERERRLRRAA
jgi:hypothetical protein